VLIGKSSRNKNTDYPKDNEDSVESNRFHS
jgi:hypothetical protein